MVDYVCFCVGDFPNLIFHRTNEMPFAYAKVTTLSTTSTVLLDIRQRYQLSFRLPYHGIAETLNEHQ